MIKIILNKIITKIKINKMLKNPIVIDDNTGKERRITGLVEFNSVDKGIACCFDEKYYPLRKCVIKADGKLHCTASVIGSVLWNPYPTPTQLRLYNIDYDDAYGNKIKCIHTSDGDIIAPEEE